MHPRLSESWHSRWATEIRPALLYLSLLDISLPTIDGNDHDCIDEILSDILVLEGDKSKAARLPSVNIFQNASINDLSVLLKMLLQLIHCEFEIESSDENLALRVFESHLDIIIASLLSLY